MDLIVGQFAGNSKAVVPATKNHNLRTAYNINFVDSDGYDSDFTHNSEGKFQSIANSSTMYDTTDDESNGESVSEEKGLNVNAAASTRPKKSILKRGGKKIFKSSEMPAAAVAKMMASKQLEVRDPITKEIVSYMTYSAKIANVDYTSFDSMITEDVADKEIHYNANLSHAHEVEFRVNLSK